MRDSINSIWRNLMDNMGYKLHEIDNADILYLFELFSDAPKKQSSVTYAEDLPSWM
jgi:hypothetical protein